MAVKGKEEVILVRPGEVDRNGDPVGGDAQVGIFEQCIVWPRISTEVSEKGTVISEGYNVWIPWQPKGNRDIIDLAMEVKATDRVVVRGDDWQIDGTPADQRTMKSKRLGVQMTVKRIV
jgi:hypothetical protein